MLKGDVYKRQKCHWAERMIATRGAIGRQIARAKRRNHPGGLGRQGGGITQQMADCRLDRAFGVRQTRGLARDKGGPTKIGIKRAQAGGLGQGGGLHGHDRADWW